LAAVTAERKLETLVSRIETGFFPITKHNSLNLFQTEHKMRGAKRSSSIALGKTENLLSSREKVAIEIPNDETRHLLEYQVLIHFKTVE
jgi:hypothetical protein